MTVPSILHVITDDDILARPDFAESATALLADHGSRLALHLRGPRTCGRVLYDLATRLAAVAKARDGRILVNDRADVALAAGVDGIQLGARSLPVPAARALRPEWTVGASVHGVEEAEIAERDGADFLVLGTIWPTASHPGRPGAGPEGIAVVAARVAVPIVAIGGVTPDRGVRARRAGAHGIAVLRGVWEARDPGEAAAAYIEAWEAG